MFVYVAAASPSGPSKIGIAADPRKRLRALQTGSAAPLSLFLMEPVGQAAKQVERSVHASLDGLRAAGGGKEWFEVTPGDAAAAVRSAAVAANAVLDDSLSLNQLQDRTILAWVRAQEERRAAALEDDESHDEREEIPPPCFIELFARTLQRPRLERFDFNDYLLSLEEGMWLRWAFERLGQRLPTGSRLDPYLKAVRYLEEEAHRREHLQPSISWVEWSAARELSYREAGELARIWDKFAPLHNLVERNGPHWATRGIDDHVDDVHLFALRGDAKRGDRDRIVFCHLDFRIVLVPERRLDLWGDKKWCLNLNPLNGVPVSGYVTPVFRSKHWIEPFRPWLRHARQRVNSALQRFLDSPSKRYPAPRPYDGIQPASCVWCQLPTPDEGGHY